MSPFNFDLTTDNYVAPVYEDTPAVVKSHRISRFGNTDELGLVITGTDADKRSYVIGVVSISIVILLICTIWSIVLIVLKCLGKKVGCAAGIAPKLPVVHDTQQENDNEIPGINKEEDGEDEKDERVEKQVERAKRTILWTRLIFIACGLGNIISASIFVNYGVNSLQNAITDVENSLYKINDVVYQTSDMLDDFIVAEKDVVKSREDFDVQTSGNNYCSGKVDAPFKDLIFGLSETLSNKGAGITTGARNLQSDLAKLTDLTSDVLTNMHKIDWIFQIAIVIACIQIIITILLISGVVLAWAQCYPEPFRCIQSYMLLPFFVLLVFLSALFACAFVCAAIVGSDFCFGGPDAKVLAALEEANFSSVVFNLIAYYVRGCIDPIVPGLLSNFTYAEGDTLAALAYTHEVIGNVTEYGLDLFIKVCGTNGYAITQLLNVTDLVLHTLVETATGAKELLYCSNFNPIYVNIAYDAVCYNGVNGIRTIFATQLWITIFSMVMVTLRVSWQQIEDLK